MIHVRIVSKLTISTKKKHVFVELYSAKAAESDGVIIFSSQITLSFDNVRSNFHFSLYQNLQQFNEKIIFFCA